MQIAANGNTGIVPPSIPPRPMPDLKLGSHGAAVMIAQRFLTRAGFPVPMNGVFDKRTLNAVRGYQLSRQLPMTGEIHQNTWSALQRSAAPKMIKEGASGPSVRDLQKLLLENHYPCRLTGKYDAVTVAMVKDFQRTRGLEVDGIVGPKTSRALAEHAGKIPGRPTLRLGDSGPAVRHMQSLLRSVVPCSVTGTFDQQTLGCLQEFQRRNGLVPDGICGPKTWAALQKLEPRI